MGGDRNWWLPRWLDRLLPHLDVDGAVNRIPVAARPTGAHADDRRDAVPVP